MGRHQDDGEDLSEERNRIEGEKRQLEEQVHHLQADIKEYEKMGSQQQADITRLLAQATSMQKKCNIFKANVKGLTEKNQAWEDSYKAQSDNLVQHEREISRLNGLIRTEVGHYANRSNLLSAQATPVTRTIPRCESRGRYTF